MKTTKPLAKSKGQYNEKIEIDVATEEEQEIWDFRNPNVFGEPGSSDAEAFLPEDPAPKEKDT